VTQWQSRISGLGYVNSTSVSNPLWYAAALLCGIIGFFSVLKYIPAGVSMFTAIMIFLVLPFGIPIGIVAFVTWYTDWQTDERGITKTKFGHDKVMMWSEIGSARLLRNRMTELIAGPVRWLVPGGDLTLTASVWQHLHEKKGYPLPEAIAPLWDALPENLPEEATWENPRMGRFMMRYGWRIIVALVFLIMLTLVILKRRALRDSWCIDLVNLISVFYVLSARSAAEVQRITVNAEGMTVEAIGLPRTQLKWDMVSARIHRRAIVVNAVVIPLAQGDERLSTVVAIIRKHLRENKRPSLLAIPPDLLLTRS
jgi:hypothetical protein